MPPAVIAVDVLYSGETQAGADEWLAEAAGQYGNVVTACAAEFGSTLKEDAEGEYSSWTPSLLRLLTSRTMR